MYVKSERDRDYISAYINGYTGRNVRPDDDPMGWNDGHYDMCEGVMPCIWKDCSLYKEVEDGLIVSGININELYDVGGSFYSVGVADDNEQLWRWNAKRVTGNMHWDAVNIEQLSKLERDLNEDSSIK